MQLAAYLLASLSILGITQYRPNQGELELRHYIEAYKGEHLKTNFFDKETTA